MQILVTGGNGQFGCELQELSAFFPDHRFHFTDKDELDVTDGEAVYAFMKSKKTECLINAAGFTAVDLAESQPELAQEVNAAAVGRLASAAARLNVLMMHLSTDYVFDGKQSRPYTENDTASPKTTYGKSKLNGELEVLFNAKRAVIIRTSWLYSAHGKNFMKTILERGAQQKELTVVYDQIGSPTWTRDLALAMLQMIPRLPVRMRTEIYNYSNEGVASWYDFAKAIVEFGGLDCVIKPILSSEMKSAAARPHFSLLDKSRIKKDFGLQIPHWRDSLQKCLESMQKG